MKNLWGNNRTNEKKIFWDLSKIIKKFRRSEKSPVSLEDILEKCKCKRNLGKHLQKFKKFLRKDFEEKLGGNLKKYFWRPGDVV